MAAAVAGRLREAGASVVPVKADITKRDSLEGQLAGVRRDFGEFDIIVNNAGRWTVSPFLATDPQMWQDELAVNLMGTLHVVHLLLGSLLERGYGRVVNIVSDSARVGEPNVTLYAAAKAAVGGFSRALAKEVGPSGVTVNCVSLSTTVTPGSLDTFTAEQLERMPRFYPLRRLGTPEDAAAAVAYLASDDAGWVTGQTIGVNGGYAITP
jgi:3-oxoacyl-[acyl-carrier protein] reductase